MAAQSGSVYVFRTSDGGATYGPGGQADGLRRRAVRPFWRLRGDRRRHRSWSVHTGRQRHQQGSAYVFHTSDGGATYVEITKLTASDAAAYDKFGISVAIDGGTVVIGPNITGRRSRLQIGLGLRLPDDRWRHHVRPGGQADGSDGAADDNLGRSRGNRRRYRRGRGRPSRQWRDRVQSTSSSRPTAAPRTARLPS